MHEEPGNFRPISLCNTIYKILSKVLSNRLNFCLPKLIAKEKTQIFLGRSILDEIIIIQETIHLA